MDDEKTPPPDQPAAPPPRRRSKRRLALYALAAVVVVLLAVVALLPTLLSTGPGTRVVERIASGQVEGRVTIGDLSLGWLSGVRAADVKVFDDDDRNVIQVADFSTDAGLLEFLGGTIDLGDARLRANLAVVEVYDDGTTNLDRLFGASDDESAATDPPDVTGDIAADLTATVQYVGDPDDTADDGPVIDVAAEGVRLALSPGAIENVLPVRFEVDNAPAGSLRAEGSADLSAGTVDQTLAMNAVDLRAATTAAAAFGAELPAALAGLAGTADGLFVADSAAGTLAGSLAVAGFATDVYQTSKLALDLDGGFAETDAGLAADVRRLFLTTDDGTATLSANATLPAEDIDAAAVIAGLGDIEVDVQSDYLVVDGGGPSLAGLSLTFVSGGAPLRFGGPHGDDYQIMGQVQGEVRTRADAGAIQAAVEFRGAGLRFDDYTRDVPRRLDLVTLDVRLIPTLAFTEAGPAVSEVQIDVTAVDPAGEVLVLDATATDLDPATGSVGNLAVDRLEVADVERARSLVDDWTDLERPDANPGPIALAGALSWDGEARQATVTTPLTITADGERIVNVAEADATLPTEGAATVKLAADVPALDALVRLLAAFGIASPDAAPTGSLAVAFAGTADPADPTATLAGDGTLTLGDVLIEGLQVAGDVPITAADGVVSIAADAPPLVANNGSLSLAGAKLDLAATTLTLPEGEFASDVSLNPVLVSQLGRYVNPLFFDPEDARGVLDVRLVGATALNLTDPFAPGGGRVVVEFDIRDLYLDNDVIGALADNVAGQADRAIRGRLGAVGRVPGLREEVEQRLAVLSLSEDVRREFSSVRGGIPAGRVALEDGVADTRITFDLFDPRAEGDPDASYPVTFAGRVDTNSLAIGLDVTVPRNLIEKWTTDGQDLIDLFGPDPIRNLVPERGLTLGFGGTNPDPTVDATRALEAVVPRAVELLLRNKTEGAIRRGLEDGLRGLFD